MIAHKNDTKPSYYYNIIQPVKGPVTESGGWSFRDQWSQDL